MADPLSVLGAVAAASQLLEQGANVTTFLWGLYSKIKHAPESIRKQIIQVEQLLGLSRLFLQHPSLQKDSVASILGTCLLRAQEFQNFLKKILVTDTDGRFKKLKKSFEAVMKEKEIIVLFDHLEKEKTSLMLCIQEIDSKLLDTIGIEIKDIKTGLDDVSHVINDTAYNLTEVVSILPNLSAKVTEIHIVVKSLQSATLNQQAAASPSDSPSDTKYYYIVPNRRVRGFIGRDDILARIEFGFSSGPSPRIVVIRGMGGQGKTQVALEYCRQAKNNAVRAIFWVDANSEISVKKSFESISESIKAPGQAIQDEERVRFVMEKLEKWPDSWIMVFDNHDDPAPFNLQDFIPEGEKGCILITSRHTDTGSLVDPENFIELQGLSEKESLELLFKQSRVKETGSDLQHGKHIVERLGYHPLAITQAGSYIQLRKIELHKFMDHYNMQRKDILQQTPQMTQYRRKLTDEAKETALNVFTTWELSFQQLQTKSTGIDSEDLMTLFAFFDCKDISDQLFCEARESYINSSGAGRSLETFLDVQDRWDQEKFVRVLIDFTQMSLAQAWSRDELGYCHLTLLPLVKDWIQLRTNMITFRNYSKFAADILTATLRNTYQHRKFQLSFPDRQRILSHFDTYSENIEFLKAGSQAEPFDSFYGEFHYFEFLATQFLDENGLYAEAEVTGRRVAEWLEHEFGIKDERTLAGLNNLVEALFRQDKYEEAEAIQRRVLQVSEENLGSEHPDHLTRLSNLASVLRRRGMLDEAEEIIRGVLQARENILGPEHNDTLSSLSSLGITITYQGRYEEAEKIHRIVIQRSEKVLGLDHPNICRSLWDLAWPLGKQKKYTEATEYYTRAYLGHEKVFGASHPDTIRCRRQHLKMLEEMERSDLNP